MLEHLTLNCQAFHALSGNAVKLLVRLHVRYDGHNNGKISMSVREAAQEVGCCTNHASKLFHELQEKGFIRVATPGAFSLKARHATTWHLNWLPERRPDDRLAQSDRTYMRWRPPPLPSPEKKQDAVPPGETVDTTPCDTPPPHDATVEP